MTFEEVAKHFRQSIAPLSAEQIIIVTNDGDFSGRGRISAMAFSLKTSSATLLNSASGMPIPQSDPNEIVCWCSETLKLSSKNTNILGCGGALATYKSEFRLE